MDLLPQIMLTPISHYFVQEVLENGFRSFDLKLG